MTSNEPRSGTDPDGRIAITVDRGRRVVGVDVLRADAVSTPSDLAAGVAGAYRAALVPSRPAGTAERQERPVARAPRITAPPLTADSYHRHHVREASRAERARPRAVTGAVTGISANECVSVTLPPASAVGSVDADAGWLAHASPTSIARAVTEAFAAAYAERDR